MGAVSGLGAVSLICNLLSRISLADGVGKLRGYARNPNDVYHGRYTRDIREAELLIPRWIREDGEFLTFDLPKFYDRQEISKRKKRSTDTRLHLVLPFAGADHHVELEPFHDFISPGMVVERRSIGADPSSPPLAAANLGFEWPSEQQCHYRGRVRGHDDSRAALSLCDGVAGIVHTDHGRYFIEPLYEDVPDADGRHIHVAYKKEAPHESISQSNGPSCDTDDDWESSWTRQLERLQRDKTEENLAVAEKLDGSGKASSSTHSVHRYIELALVADRRFIDFHNGTNYEQYLLTVMNIVSDFYHDASVGNQIDVVIVRMIFLEKENEEIDLHISKNGEKTLQSFSKWVERLNPSDPQHPNHFDIGALVTRHDICAEGSDCNLLGLAYVAAACDRKKAACINEDSGLLLGVVIAHEMGHTLGCSHDTKEISGCPSQDKDESYYVMSPIVFIYSIRWSACSRKFITSFLESGLGECLLNNPKNPPEKYKYPNMLPGAMYDADFQCKLSYPGSKPCDFGEEECADLWCNVGGNNCKSKGAPPADGTKCAPNKWCIHKKCVAVGSRGDAVNGGWGGWGSPGQCSRTCGGGIQFAERECNNPVPKNGGRYCVGERKKFHICNTKPCDASKPSFRSAQCSEFDGSKALSGGPHRWKPFLREDLDLCALYCVNQAGTFMKLSPTAKDGTPCRSGTYHMCISGACRKVGCDWVLDSEAVDDVCGVCKGGGTGCKKIDGEYKELGRPGYNKIVTVPKGSRSVRVYEKSEHTNTLAVKLAKSNQYCLNGNSREQASGDYQCAGATLMYKHVKANLEEITIKEPLKDDIEIQYVFYQMGNPGVYYEYFADSTDESYTAKYSWEFVEWEDCDVKCGGGTKISEATCVEQRAGKVVSNFCRGSPKPPPRSQICNDQPCPAKWRVSQWSRCSGCGGRSGKMHRKIQCVRPGLRPTDDYVQANFDACPGNPPIQTRKCVGRHPCLKPCKPKKARNAVAELEGPLTSEEQSEMIDKVVDYSLAQYLEKLRGVTVLQDTKPQKAENSGDLEKLLKDWVAEEEAKLKSARIEQISQQCPINQKRSYSSTRRGAVTTPVPGSIVVDSVPDNQIVVYEAPFINVNSRVNVSDTHFHQQSDPINRNIVNSRRKKIYRGQEAIKLLNEIGHRNASRTVASGKTSPRGRRDCKTDCRIKRRRGIFKRQTRASA